MYDDEIFVPESNEAKLNLLEIASDWRYVDLYSFMENMVLISMLNPSVSTWIGKLTLIRSSRLLRMAAVMVFEENKCSAKQARKKWIDG